MYDDASIRLHGSQPSYQVTTELDGLLLPLHLFWSQGCLCLGGALGQQRDLFFTNELLQTSFLFLFGAGPRQDSPTQIGIRSKLPCTPQHRTQTLAFLHRVGAREVYFAKEINGAVQLDAWNRPD